MERHQPCPKVKITFFSKFRKIKLTKNGELNFPSFPYDFIRFLPFTFLSLQITTEQLDWDDSALTITINPMQNDVVSEESSDSENSDSDDDECKYRF